MEFDLHTLLRYQNVIWYGLWMTVFMSVVSLAIGAAIGLAACIGKLTERGLGYHLASGFIDFFRTIPEVVIIFWVYSCLPILMRITISAEACAILALSLFAGAFLAEIFRAGVLAVPPGQVEAANALGIPTNCDQWLEAFIFEDGTNVPYPLDQCNPTALPGSPNSFDLGTGFLAGAHLGYAFRNFRIETEYFIRAHSEIGRASCRERV